MDYISDYLGLVYDRNQDAVSGSESKVQFWYISVSERKVFFPETKTFFFQKFKKKLKFPTPLGDISFHKHEKNPCL